MKVKKKATVSDLLPFVYYYGLYSKQFDSYQVALSNATELAKQKTTRKV